MASHSLFFVPPALNGALCGANPPARPLSLHPINPCLTVVLTTATCQWYSDTEATGWGLPVTQSPLLKRLYPPEAGHLGWAEV